jgi:hypothetical protein
MATPETAGDDMLRMADGGELNGNDGQPNDVDEPSVDAMPPAPPLYGGLINVDDELDGFGIDLGRNGGEPENAEYVADTE